MVKKMSVETLVLSVDFDGCSDTKYARNALIHRIADFVRGTSYQKIIICIGSMRQSVWIDFLNAMQTNREEVYQSCRILGLDFIEALQPHLDKNIIISFENILTYDVYNQLPSGTTFSFFQQANYEAYHALEQPVSWTVDNVEKVSVDMLKWSGKHYELSKEKIEELSTNDASKKDILYMQMHYFAQMLGDKTPFSLVLIDDLEPILSKLGRFFSDNPGLVPITCFFKGIQHAPYEQWLKPIETPWVRGGGIINLPFEQEMRRIRALALQTPHKYEVVYAVALSKLSKEHAIKMTADSVGSVDANVFPPSVSKKSKKTASSKEIEATGFVMQVVYNNPISCLGMLACLGVLVFGAGRQRTAGGAGALLIVSPWIKNCIFSGNKKDRDEELPFYRNDKQ
jgi:hypothetical protein